MALQVVTGAMLQCTFGAAPSALTVLPTNCTLDSSVPAANVMDQKPMVNIMPFGVCTSLANPSVAAATSAAMGVLTPMPCVPATVAPWVPGSPTVLIGNMPALNDLSTCMCTWGGVISVIHPGQVTTMIA